MWATYDFECRFHAGRPFWVGYADDECTVEKDVACAQRAHSDVWHDQYGLGNCSPKRAIMRTLLNCLCEESEKHACMCCALLVNAVRERGRRMTSNIARPAHLFFYHDSHSLCVSQYAAPLRSERDVSIVCGDRKIILAVCVVCVASRLFPLFKMHADTMEVVRLRSGNVEDIQNILSGCQQQNSILVFAAKQYQRMLTSLCSIIVRPIPVIIPTGFVVLAVPKARYRIQKAACVCYSTLQEMLGPFQDEKLLLWNDGQMARYVLGPALALFGMASMSSGLSTR
jgi:hypothetical protein